MSDALSSESVAPAAAFGTAPTVRITRVYEATPQAVFDAWTKPEQLSQWLCPFDLHVADAAVDLRVGGAYHVLMRGEDDHEHHGVFEVIDPPGRLVMSWAGGGLKGVESRLTIGIEEAETADGKPGARMTLIHERFPDAETSGNYEGGWNSAFDKLEAALKR